MTPVESLLAARTAQGVWEGRLSSSALSTATAILALSHSPADAALMQHARRWLADTQNADGGWGDTTLSLSNISTTALCWAALPDEGPFARPARLAEQWLRAAAGAIDPATLSAAIARRYGKDRTFSVPILTALAIAGRLGDEQQAWRHVPQLPFELAALPHRTFQILRLPVVSYALPALIAIGLARHRRKPARNLASRLLRQAVTAKVLRVLEKIQPSNGGFLEATPLTSFVAMSLIAAGLASHPITLRCLEFLRQSARPDGSWPIDTNLSTWITTLSINALAESGGVADVLPAAQREQLRDWLLAQQFQVEHPYTHAAPGAWSWTNLPGAVPDADDTAGALLALKNLDATNDSVRAAAVRGVQWLLDLQNRDGGMPTFCKGWGHLPFDRSGADLTAHAIRAWLAWIPQLNGPRQRQARTAVNAAVTYLQHSQRQDGSWAPLWFGNQHAPNDENPTFGTARVLLALCDAREQDSGIEPRVLSRGLEWLLGAQAANGGWGGAAGVDASIEETAVAVCALARATEVGIVNARPAIDAALSWLAAHADQPCCPIGFYFASLWYFEELYPLVFQAAAWRRSSRPLLRRPC